MRLLLGKLLAFFQSGRQTGPRRVRPAVEPLESRTVPAGLTFDILQPPALELGHAVQVRQQPPVIEVLTSGADAHQEPPATQTAGRSSGPANEDCTLRDVSHLVFAVGGLMFLASRGESRGQFQVRNVSNQPIRGPLFLVLHGLTGGRKRGRQRRRAYDLPLHRRPLLAVHRMLLPDGDVLPPGGEMTARVRVRNPFGRGILFVPRLVAGSEPGCAKLV